MFKNMIYNLKLKCFYKRLEKKYKYYKKNNIPFPIFMGDDFKKGSDKKWEQAIEYITTNMVMEQ